MRRNKMMAWLACLLLVPLAALAQGSDIKPPEAGSSGMNLSPEDLDKIIGVMEQEPSAEAEKPIQENASPPAVPADQDEGVFAPLPVVPEARSSGMNMPEARPSDMNMPEARPSDMNPLEALPSDVNQPAAPAAESLESLREKDMAPAEESMPESLDANASAPQEENAGGLWRDAGAIDSWKISVMFGVTELRMITKILAAIEARRRAQEMGEASLNQDDVLRDIMADIGAGTAELEAEMLAKMPKESPAFFLNSIVYKSPDDWAVWVNGRKMDKETTDGDLSIARVGKKSVAFVWHTEYLDFVAPDWSEAVADRKGVTVDADGMTVRFTLQPNQTFVVRAMQIVEGKAYGSPLSVEDMTQKIRAMFGGGNEEKKGEDSAGDTEGAQEQPAAAGH